MKKKILILNFGGIGDQILFFPVLDTLKKSFENSHITFVTESRSKSAIHLTNKIDELFVCDLKGKNKFIELFKFLGKAVFGKYDMVVSSGSSKIVSILLFLTGIKRRIGYDSGFLSRLLLTQAVPLSQQQYASDMYHDLVADFTEVKEPKIPELILSLDENKKKALSALIPRTEKKKLVIHPGVSQLSIEKNIIKFWSIANWTEFIRKLISSGEYQVILTGGPDDIDSYRQIKEILPVSESITDLTEKISGIDEFAYIVELSDMLVCVDSAPMHIAVGLKKKVLAIFGPTDEQKLLPSNDDLFTPLRNENLTCRPCLWDKRQVSCESQECLNIAPEYAFQKLSEKLLIKI